MPPTVIRGTQVLDGSIQRADLDVTTAGKAVIAKLVQGTGIALSSTGADSGTGDVTVSGVDPGTWAALSLGTGWTAPTQAQFRIETNGTVKTVYFRGMIQAAYSALGTTAFTLPSAAFPSMTRSAVLAGAQNTGTASDVAAYIITVSSAGVATPYFLGAAAFVWADHSQTQMIYLEGLSFSL
jgi:hypothetical protein